MGGTFLGGRNTLGPMSTPHGSTPRSPERGQRRAPDGESGISGESPSVDRPALVNEPTQRTTIPLKIMTASLVALLVTVGVIAFLFTRTTATVTPDAAPLPPEPAGAPTLPLRAGDYVREPGEAAAPPDFGVDRTIQTSSAYYRGGDGQNALIAVAARPVDDPKALLDQISVRAQRQVGDGWCGREETADLDVCILTRNRTAVLTVGLRDQTPDEIMQATGQLLQETA